jgi:hypothetical protein
MLISHDDQLRRARAFTSRRQPRDLAPLLAAELNRLREREGSLQTILSEGPLQLIRIRRRIVELERRSR